MVEVHDGPWLVLGRRSLVHHMQGRHGQNRRDHRMACPAAWDGSVEEWLDGAGNQRLARGAINHE